MQIRSTAIGWNPAPVKRSTKLVKGIPRAEPTSSGAAGAAKTKVKLPKTYKRLVAKKTGDSFRDVATVVEKPLPTPAENEVLVRVQYAGINGGCETFRARGDHIFAKNTELEEFGLGAEACGVVVATGKDVDTLKVGDNVAYSAMSAFSQYSVSSVDRCLKVDMCSPEMAALALSAVIACASIENVLEVKSGDTVLVTAAAGGTGHFAVQFAQLAGAKVIATCGGFHKARALECLGLERVIDYTLEDVATVLKNEFPDGLDVVYEGVGGAMLKAALDNLAPKGKVLTIGYISQYPHADSEKASQPIAEGLPTPEDLFWKGMTVKRGEQTIMGTAMPKDPTVIPKCRERVFELFREGSLRVWVDTSESFQGIESIPDAIDHMLQGKHIGKVVVAL
ncbi:hypothetical protein BSKO_02199 [Bryopsis sp. KO-2023]|nr:hypothetical protein BSKO_02199 [Bryopsis sp. KO-2023]